MYVKNVGDRQKIVINELPQGRALKLPTEDFPPSGGVSESVARGATRRFLRGRASGNYTHTTIKNLIFLKRFGVIVVL